MSSFFSKTLFNVEENLSLVKFSIFPFFSISFWFFENMFYKAPVHDLSELNSRKLASYLKEILQISWEILAGIVTWINISIPAIVWSDKPFNRISVLFFSTSMELSLITHRGTNHNMYLYRSIFVFLLLTLMWR